MDSLLIAASEGSSKTPFYILGGSLVAFAVILALIGISRPSFPGGSRGGRTVLLAAGLLVLATLGAAVATASKPDPEEKAKAIAEAKQDEAKQKPAAETAPQPAETTPAETTTTTPAPAPAGGPVALQADPNGALAYVEKTLSAKSGDVTIDFANQSPVPHNVTVEKDGKRLGGTRDITQTKAILDLKALEPGSYTFYCSVPGHRQAGMEGTLTVR